HSLRRVTPWRVALARPARALFRRLLAGRAAPGQRRDRHRELAGVDGLGEVEVEAGGERAFTVFGIAVGRERDGGRALTPSRFLLAHATQQRIAILARHL